MTAKKTTSPERLAQIHAVIARDRKRRKYMSLEDQIAEILRTHFTSDGTLWMDFPHRGKIPGMSNIDLADEFSAFLGVLSHNGFTSAKEIWTALLDRSNAQDYTDYDS